MPTYRELMLPVLRAVIELGGSGAGREITAAAIDAEGFGDALVAETYPNRDRSILLDRFDWARSYCKLGGVLESPKRNVFLVSELGSRIAQMDDDVATAELVEIDRQVRARRNSPKRAESGASDDETPTPEEDEDDSWKEKLLHRLHSLTPDGFERFVLYLLREHGMELERLGGPGDEGVDGIGTSPLTSVLSTTVAVQAKRYEPSKTIGRETVALFQSDATAAGAEHGVLVTTARFSKPAKKAARGRHPTIDLIDGDKLADLCLASEIGIAMVPTVAEHFFDRFD